MSESLGLDVVAEKARLCGLATLLAERAAVRNSRGASLLAIVFEWAVNWKRGGDPRLRMKQKSMSSDNLMESFPPGTLLGVRDYIIQVIKISSAL